MGQIIHMRIPFRHRKDQILLELQNVQDSVLSIYRSLVTTTLVTVLAPQGVKAAVKMVTEGLSVELQDIVAAIAVAEQCLLQLNDEIKVIAEKGIEFYERGTGDAFYPERTGTSPKCKTFYDAYTAGFPGKPSFNDKIVELYGDDTIAFCNKGSGMHFFWGWC